MIFENHYHNNQILLVETIDQLSINICVKNYIIK